MFPMLIPGVHSLLYDCLELLDWFHLMFRKSCIGEVFAGFANRITEFLSWGFNAQIMHLHQGVGVGVDVDVDVDELDVAIGFLVLFEDLVDEEVSIV